MSKYSQKIVYDIKTDLDTSGINRLLTELNKVQSAIDALKNNYSRMSIINDSDIAKVEKLKSLLTSSFNTKFGLLDVKAFSKGLDDSGLRVNRLFKSLESIGPVGKTSFNSLIGRIGKLDDGLTAASKSLDKVFYTFSNTVRWGLTASVVDSFTNSLGRSIDYIKELDNSLTQIMLVTDYSRQNMNDYAKTANETAKALGSVTTSMTDASLIFAQQGFNLEQSQQLAELSTKLGKASEQDTSTASDQITAYMNAYGLDKNITRLKSALDSWALVANVSAADVKELARASQKAASTAATVGVSMDQLNAQIAAIESVTREAPEQIGNGLKTLYARFSDLQLNGKLDDGVTLGEVTEKLENVGVQVLNRQGKMRGVGEIIEDLMKVWKSIDDTQKAAVAQTLAGRYQLGRFNALMNRSDLYSQYKTASENAEGTLDEMTNKAIDSIEGRMNRLQANIEGIITSLVNSSDLYPFLDGLNTGLDLIQKMGESLGGLSPILTGIGSLAQRVFSTQLAQGINRIITNSEIEKVKRESRAEAAQLLASMGLNVSDRSKGSNPAVTLATQMNEYSGQLTEEQRATANAALEKTVNLQNKVIDNEDEIRKRVIATNTAWREMADRTQGIMQTSDTRQGHVSKVLLDPNMRSNIYDNLLSDKELDQLQERLKRFRSLGWKAQDDINFIRSSMEKGQRTSQGVTVGNGMLDTMRDSLAKAQDFAEEFGKVNSDMWSMPRNSKEWAQGLREYPREIRQLVSNIIDLQMAFDNASTSSTRLDESYTTLTDKSFLKLDKAVRQVEGDLSQLVGTLENQPALINNVNELEQINEQLSETSVALETQAKANREFMGNIIRQQDIDNVISMTGAITQLSFAWQSISNLGSIWANTDLSQTEKIQQTIMNLSLSIPMLIDGFSTLQKVAKLGSLERLVDTLGTKSVQAFAAAEAGANGVAAAEGRLTLSTLGATIAQKASAAGSTAMGLAFEGAAVGVTALKTALDLLTGPLGIIITLGAMVASTIGEMNEQARQSSITDAMESYNKAAEKSSVDMSSFDKAYQDYKRTGQASDELKQSSLDLAKSLDIAGGKALANSGNYEQLAQAIIATKHAADDAAASQAQNSLAALNEAVNKGPGVPHPGNMINAIDSSHWDVTDERWLGVSPVIDSDAFKSSDITGKLHTLNDAIHETTEQIETLKEAQKGLAEDSSQYSQYQEWINDAEAYKKELQSFSNSDALKDASTILEQQAKQQAEKLAESHADAFSRIGEEAAKAILTDKNGDYAAIANFYEAQGTEDGKKYMDALLTSLDAYTVEDKLTQVFGSIEDERSRIIEESSLSEDDKIKLIATLDRDSTKEHINNVIREMQSSNDFESIQIKDNYKEDLDKTTAQRTKLKELWDAYANKEDEGGFSEKEVANLLKANPEYITYLNKVGDVYKLNQQALDAYNASVREQENMVKDMTGGLDYLKNYQDVLDNIRKDYSHGADSSLGEGVEEAIDGLIDKNKELNQAYMDGELSSREYFDKLGEAIRESGVYDELDTLNGKFDETTDYLEQTVSVLSVEIADGLNQANKQFIKGDKSVKDYVEALQSASSIQMDLLRNTYDLTESLDGLAHATDENDTAAQEAADSFNELKKSQEGLEGVESLIDALTDGADFLREYTDEAGKLKDEIMDDDRLSDYVDSLTQSFIDFSQTSAENMQDAVNDITAATGESADHIRELLDKAMNGSAEEAAEASAELAKITGQSLDSVESLSSAAMENVGQAIGNASTAIGHVLSALGDAVAHFDYTIEATPYIKGGPISIDENGIHLPTFGFDIKGKGGANVSKFADALSAAGGFFKNQGAQQARQRATNIDAYSPKQPHTVAPEEGPGEKKPEKEPKPPKEKQPKPPKEPKSPKEKEEKPYEPKLKANEKNNWDRYERVRTLLEAIGKEMDKLAAKQNRLMGKNLADNMKKQIDLLLRQIDLQKEKLSIQEREAAELRNNMAFNFGATFDEEGFLKNYGEIYHRMLRRVNDLTEQYNRTTTQEGQELLEKRIDSAKDALSQFEEFYKRYDTLVSNDIKDTEKSLEDIRDKIEDLRIEAFNTAAKALDNIKDIQEALVDFNRAFSRGIKENPFDLAGDSVLKLKNYFDVATEASDKFYDDLIAKQREFMNSASSEGERQFYKRQIEIFEKAKQAQGKQTLEEGGTGYLDMSLRNVSDIMNQIRQYESGGSSDIFGKNEKGLYEAAKTIFDQATNLIKDYWSELENLHTQIVAMIDDISERMERRAQAYEDINEELEHQRDLIEMIHGDEAFDQLNQALAAQQTNYRSQINDYQAQLGVWKDMLKGMKEGSEEWTKVQDKITETQRKLNDLVKSSLENLQQQYKNTVSKITKAWTSGAFKGSGAGNDLEWMQTEWELINRNSDYYLDNVNKSYNIQKLQSKYLDLLDDTKGLRAQQMITQQMQEQLKYLRDKTKLSEYDVQYAQAQLEILQRRIALEEAQQNKNQMKLRRDTQGNYSYVYAANEDDTRKAQDALLDAQMNAYNLSKNQMRATQNDSLSALSDAKTLIDNIWNNANLSLEEKKKRTQTIIGSLKEYLAATSEQLSTSERNIIQDFLGMCDLLTEENSESLKKVHDEIIQGNKNAFDQIDTRWSTSLTKWLQNLDQFNKQTDSMFDQLVGNAERFQSQIDSIGKLVGQNFNDMSDSINKCVDATNKLSSAQASFISQLKADAGIVQEYEGTLNKYVAKINDAQNSMRGYKRQVDELGKRLTAKEQESANLSRYNQQLSGKINEGNRGGSKTRGALTGGAGGPNIQPGARVGFRGKYYYDSWGQTPAGYRFADQPGGVQIDWIQTENAGDYNIHISSPWNGYDDLGWVKREQLFRSGGYTGTWGANGGIQQRDNGKLAWLHEKELVLNEEDTSNILEAVKEVRSITGEWVSNLKSSVVGMLHSLIPGQERKPTQDIRQDVHVTAEFPNATSALEIESALMSLNDRVVQYAYQNR